MREIKFRAWDGRRMTLSGIAFSNSTGLMTVPAEDILMQYTGLKDSKGVGIYESDFVRIKISPYWDEDEPSITHGYFEVVFSEGMFCLRMPEGCYPLCEYMGQEPEVIGDIYKNPELVNK